MGKTRNKKEDTTNRGRNLDVRCGIDKDPTLRKIVFQKNKCPKKRALQGQKKNCATETKAKLTDHVRNVTLDSV